MALQFVLDLDETLVHSTWHDGDSSFGPSEEALIVVHMRPYVKEFISFLHQHGYPYGFYTASGVDYANMIVKEYVGSTDHMFIYSSDDCLKDMGIGPKTFKSLNMIWRRHPEFHRETTILVDDLDSTSGMFQSNWYKIPGWEGRMDDEELKKLMDKIENGITKVPFDIRMIIDK